MFAKGTKITHAVVIKKLNEILQARGKKRTDRAAQIEPLQLLVQITSENNLGEDIIIKIRFNITASLYDYNPNLDTYMKPETWQKRMDCINELMNILFANPSIFVRENILEESENMHNTDQSLCVCGCIFTLVERMDEEFTKIMQNTDPHSQGEPEAWASVGGKVQGLKQRIVLRVFGKPALPYSSIHTTGPL